MFINQNGLVSTASLRQWKTPCQCSDLFYASFSINTSLYVHCLYWLKRITSWSFTSILVTIWSTEKTLRQVVKTVHLLPSPVYFNSEHKHFCATAIRDFIQKSSIPPGDDFPRSLLILNIVQFRCKKALAVWGPAPFAVISIQHRQNTAVCALNKTSGSRFECVCGTDSLAIGDLKLVE